MVDSVSPTTVNADTPTRLFITGSGFTVSSFDALQVIGAPDCQDLTILSETSATCIVTLSAFEGAQTSYTLKLVAVGSEPETLAQTLTVMPTGTEAIFPSISSVESPRGVGERAVISGSDFGIVEDTFAGDVIFGSIFASRADIEVTEIEGADDGLSVVVPSGYAPGAQVEVRVINAEGLQSAPATFIYGQSRVVVSPSDALLHTTVSLEIPPLQSGTITGISFTETQDEFGLPLSSQDPRTCANLTFLEQQGFYSCELPSPNVAGETTLTYTRWGDHPELHQFL